MCEIEATSVPSKSGTGVDINISCAVSGKPIVDMSGPWCVDRCDTSLTIKEKLSIHSANT